MENWKHILEVVRLTVSSFTVSARILRKISYQQYKEYVSAKVSIFPCFFCVKVAKITQRKNVFVFVVGHAYTRWRDFMSFVNFNKFLKIPNSFPQTKFYIF